MSYELIWTKRGVTKRYFGHVTGEDLLHSVEETEASPRFDDLRYVINDFLQIAGIDLNTISLDLIEEIAAIDSSAAVVNPRIKVAIVATNADILRLASAYEQSDLRKFPTAIFATLDEANAWLGTSTAP